MPAFFSPLVLPAPADLARQVRAALPLQAEVVWSSETGSTNADVQARLRARDLSADNQLILHGAHMQNAGRGRAGRAFQTQPGDALLMSAGFRLRLPLATMPALSIVSGLAACMAMASTLPSPEGLKLKWPNDLLWQDAKLSGVLVESVMLGPVTEGCADVGVVIGMGTNLRGADAMSAYLGRAIADWQQTGGSQDACELVCTIALAWHAAVQRFVTGGLDGFLEDFARYDALLGRPVRVIDGERLLFEGNAAGLDPSGRLRVLTAQGEQLVTVGDVSVRAQTSPSNTGVTGATQ
ncbi:biotin--[acetyl-CoA-carboxylase] ligase [Pigmentiphaga aceris]|uniref:biotin--[biotin carboxyl-carrier protein] ligase n=1 Tax=Pigmentiphaga aceris TaxID=1940612 RepID=A0A5C0B2W7_9BURK|nr:biotin--[acetyl-CoA-carboxylase] ligase [Pigmentiphaga aceris]QEI08605.1 biotin--[acetyl-CoA-carboxylase] ligase [Pigmentiphaga aceris]